MRKRYDVGTEVVNNRGVKAVILSIKNKGKKKLSIRTEYGSELEVNCCSISLKNWKDPNYPSVYGKGYLGQGKYSPRNKNGDVTLSYRKWKSMLERCYDKRSKENSYYDTEVCEEWHNFQNFAAWFSKARSNYNTKYELDKDLLGDGNLYSPKTCCLLPKKVNNLIKTCFKGYIESEKNKRGYYNVYCMEDRLPLHLGSFKNKLVAEDCLLDYKIKRLTSQIPILHNFKLSEMVSDKLESNLTSMYVQSIGNKVRLLKLRGVDYQHGL